MSRSSFLFVLLRGSLASVVFVCALLCAYGNSIETTRAYDRSDNLVTKIDTAGYLGLTFTYGVAGYDDNKNPVQETTGGVMAGYSWTTAGGSTADYDEEDRLTYWNRPTRPESREWPTGANTGLTDVGDWDSVKIDGITQTRTHGSAHELTHIGANPITLDAKGNTTVDASKTTTHNYTWDFDNRMSGASVDGLAGNEIQYTYDALGRRVSKTVPSGMTSTTTVYACMTRGLAESPHAGQVSSEFTANALPTAPLRKYIYGSYIDEPVLLVDLTNADGNATNDNTAGEDYYFYHTNRQFCVTALTDSSASIQERYAYSPYGQTTILAPNGTTVRTLSSYSSPYQYTGRRWDPETGLYYYRSRYYDVDLSRFVGRDKILYGAGLNMYAYTVNRPLRFLDPSGLIPPVIFIDPGYSSGEILGPSNSEIYWDRYKDWIPNWSQGHGSLVYSYQAIEIVCLQGIQGITGGIDMDEIYQGLITFREFHNDLASASLVRKEGRQLVIFDAHGALGNFQEAVWNGFRVPVETFTNDSEREVTAVTLFDGSMFAGIGHMVVGVRKWRVYSEWSDDPGGRRIIVETEAWERRNGWLNERAFQNGAKEVMREIWINYLGNIGAAAVHDNYPTRYKYLEPGTGDPHAERWEERDGRRPNPFRQDLPGER